MVFWFSVILFFVMTLCLGYSVTYFVKRADNFLERWLMNIGFCLGAFAVLAVVLNLLKIQLDWMIFLAISLVIPIYAIYRRVGAKGFKVDLSGMGKINKSTIYAICALIIFIIFFAVYLKGSFLYPYLEDDDPWLHAQVTKYVAEQKTFSHNPSIFMNYIEPYPPAYAVLMGVLHQTNTNVMWNLKFFNALLISLGILFFYFFANGFFGDRRKALFAAFILAVIPCFSSHFIWASGLAITLFFPALYAADRISHDSKWWIVAAVSIAGILLVQPSNAVIFGLLFIIYWVLKAFTTKSLQKHVFLAGVVGLLGAVVFFYVPTFFKYGWEGIASGIGFGSSGGLLHFSGANAGGGLLYSWSDFIFAQTVSKMDNPIGVGIIIFFLAVFSLIFILYSLFRGPRKIFSEEGFRYLVLVVWTLFAFAGIHGNRLPIQLMPHRFWAIFAIPVALICVEGFFALGNLLEKVKIHRFFVYAVIIIGVIITAGYPKYVVETSYWPPGANWGSAEELSAYMQYVAPLPFNTKLFPLCSPDFKALAFDKYAEPWDPQYVAFKENAFNDSAADTSAWLKTRGYNLITIDSYCVGKFGMNETNAKLQEFSMLPGIKIAAQAPGFYMLALV
jgi:hypothetical protein